MRKIGLLGSSFNPPHLGHLLMAQQAIERFELEKVLLIPTKNPYHKKTQDLDYNIRFQMAQLEAKDNPKFELSSVENDISGKSYTYDVVNLLRKEYSDTSFYFIMGSDSLINFETWYKSNELIHMMNYIVFKRPEDEDIGYLISNYKDKGMALEYVEDVQVEISSSFIRKSVNEGKSIKYLVTDKIETYILENNLYEDI